MKVIRKQPLSHNCLICGIDNPYGLHAAFYEMEDQSLRALFSFDKYHQSYPERTHGGMIAAILDESIGRAIWPLDPSIWGVTMKLQVEYHQPVPYGVPLKCVAKIDRHDRMTFEGRGEIQTLDGRMLAKATGLYIKLPLSKISPQNDNDGHPDDIDVLVPDQTVEID
jgi:uncharacterized protein (TIGR00369 family)